MPRSHAVLATLLKSALVLLVLLGGAYGVFRVWQTAPVEARDAEAASLAADHPTDAGTVEIESEAAERLGIAVHPAREVQWTRTLRVYGRIVPNPSATTDMHAALPGRVRGTTTNWPTLGQTVSRGQVLGSLQVRVGPEVRLEMQNKLAEARLRQRGEEDVVKVHARTVESLKKVTDREILARSELDAALVNLAEAKIQSATAEAAVALWEKSLREMDEASTEGRSLWSHPIVATRDGTVVELAAHPGREVEAGSVLLRLVDLRRPLARLDLPPDALAAGHVPPEVEIQVAAPAAPALRGIASGTDGDAVGKHRAKSLGFVAGVDASSQFRGVWYEVQATASPMEADAEVLAWRPGLQVQAEWPCGGQPEPAIAIPASAVLFHEGRTLVYVRTAEEAYHRREVRLLQRQGDDWIIAPATSATAIGVAAGEAVVHRQAQVILSKEFLQGGGDAD